MYEVMIEEEFSAAHALRGYKGKCENLHGHNYRVEVYVRGEELDSVGMLVVTRELIKSLDHQNLNELKPFDNEINPSAEHLAGYLQHHIATRVNTDRAQVYKVRVWETSTSSATFQVS